MALTTDELTICNLALGYIGEYQVSSGNTGSKQYEACERYYDDAVKEVLTEHTWNEAKKRAILVESATPPLFGFSYQFAVPADCVKIIRLGDGENDWDFWEVENGYILTNQAQSPLAYAVGEDYVAGQYITYNDVTYSVNTSFTATDWTTDLAAYLTSLSGDYGVLYIEYICNLTTIASWSPRLRDCVAQRLAVKVSPIITNDPKTKYDLLNEFETLTIKKARSVDAQQGKVRPIIKSSWWQARYGY